MIINPPIASVLAVIGRDLIFDGFEIKGFPGFKLDKLNENTDKQVFSFNISTQDAVDNAVAEGMEFSVEQAPYNYTYKIISPPIYDLGWSMLKLDFISKEII